MLKTLLAGASALVLSSAAVLAADMPVRPPVAKAPAQVAAPLFNWTGLYYGVSGGYGWGSSRHSDPVVGQTSFDTDGWLFGGTVGYNWQNGPYVFGVEGDLSWANVEGGATSAAGPVFSELNWLGTGRVRAGYAADAYLFYVTGGVAFADVDAGNPVAGGGTGGDTRVGWTVGGGVETALSQNWTAKLEYLYVDLGDKNTYPTVGGPVDVAFKSHLVRLGLNYKF
jgi:outer membrane immunogenic protein